MVQEVSRLTGGARIMASVWPLVEHSSINWVKLSTEGLLCGSTHGLGVIDFFNGTHMHLVDHTNPRTREFVWKALKHAYHDIGIKDFQIDCTEGGGVGEVRRDRVPFMAFTRNHLSVLPSDHR